MSGHEGLPHYSKEVLENQLEVQPQEPQLPQSELADHAHQIIERVRQGLRRTPEFASALVDHYLNSDPGYVNYPKGDSDYSVQLDKDLGPNDNSRFERLIFNKTTKNSDGSFTPCLLYASSLYIDDKPVRGRVSITDVGLNTATAVQEAREFVRTNFGEPQEQSQTQQ